MAVTHEEQSAGMKHRQNYGGPFVDTVVVHVAAVIPGDTAGGRADARCCDADTTEHRPGCELQLVNFAVRINEPYHAFGEVEMPFDDVIAFGDDSALLEPAGVESFHGFGIDRIEAEAVCGPAPIAIQTHASEGDSDRVSRL